MTDVGRLLRRLDDLPSRDVWPRVGSPGYGDADLTLPNPPGRRIVAAITAIALGMGGIGLAYVAWDGSPKGVVRPDPGALVVSAAFSGGEPSLFYLTDDGRPVPLAETSGASSPVVSPDGRLVAYERELPRGRSALTVLSLSGARPPRDLIRVDGTSLSPAWSPDGSRIAIVNQGEIWLVPVDGAEPEVLHVDDAFPRSVAWAAGGDRLAFTDSSRSTMLGGCLAEGSTGIWLISPEAPRPRHLTHDGCWSVAWSPLRSSIVASGSGFAPVLVDAETGTTRRILGAPDSAAGVPGLSANGRLVGFPGGVEGLWIHDLVTGGWQRFPVDPALEVLGVSFLPEGAPIPSVVDEEICDFPDVRPTYLPWLDPGEPIPQPTMTTSAAGGGPQGLDPGYSILSWSNGDVRTPGRGRDVGGVTLWRATVSTISFPESPDVPPLPDGSAGRLYAGNDLDWAIIWGDPIPDVTGDDCSETTLVANFPNLTKAEGKQEILRIARSLVPAGTETNGEPEADAGPFVPPTRQEGEQTILPLVFPDGSRAEIAYPTELRLAELGVSPNILGDLGECGSDAIISRSDQRGEIYEGAAPLAVADGASHVELWRATREYGPRHYLVARFGPWWFHMPCTGADSDATVDQWAGSLSGRVTPDGFLVLSGSGGLRFRGAEAGPLFGPEFYLDGGRDAPGFVVLSLADACPRGIDQDRQPGYASSCVEVGDGAIRIAVQATHLGGAIDDETQRFVDDVIELLEVRDIDLI